MPIFNVNCYWSLQYITRIHHVMRRKGISIGWGGKLCSAVSCSALQRSLLTSVNQSHSALFSISMWHYHSLSYCWDSTMRNKAYRLASKTLIGFVGKQQVWHGFHTIWNLTIHLQLNMSCNDVSPWYQGQEQRPMKSLTVWMMITSWYGNHTVSTSNKHVDFTTSDTAWNVSKPCPCLQVSRTCFSLEKYHWYHYPSKRMPHTWTITPDIIESRTRWQPIHHFISW